MDLNSLCLTGLEPKNWRGTCQDMGGGHWRRLDALEHAIGVFHTDVDEFTLHPREPAENQVEFGRLSGLSGCASTAQITSGGRTHPRRLLVELGSLRAPEPGNWPGRSLAIKPTYGG